MAIKAETINQFDGFGSDIGRKTFGEYHRSHNMRKGTEGLVADRYLSNSYSQSDYAGISDVKLFARGQGRGYTTFPEVLGNYVFAGDAGNNQIYQSYVGIFSWENVYKLMNNNWFGSGMIVDQKKRLLLPGWRYLAMFDPAVSNYTTGTISLTNGSATVTGSGTTFIAGDVGKVLRVVGENTFYRISSYSSATSVTLASNYTGTTGSGKTYVIYRAWTDQWKDFTTEISSLVTPTDVYEDTVLFGRANNITSLNTLTDTVTTDSSPAFDMPTGFECVSISANTTGILLSFNFQGKGVLVLWDNYSDRSIAPWIRLDDQVIQVAKVSDGWLVVTTKAIYKTNGYSYNIFSSEFLDTSIGTLGDGTFSNAVVIGNSLYIAMNSSSRGKRRSGLYIMNLDTKLFEYFPVASGIQTDLIKAIFYNPEFANILFACGTSIQSLITGSTTSTKYHHYVTSPIGQGENMKYAEALKIPIGIAKDYIANNLTKSFTIQAKINKLDRQLYETKQIKTTATVANQITVNESTYPEAEVGDEVEFLDGANASTTFNITSISGGGTATAVYTLDRDMPNLPVANANIITSGFKLIDTKTYTDIGDIPNIYFNIKNRYKAKKFMIKITIFGATVPIEIKPFQFIYDDTGLLE